MPLTREQKDMSLSLRRAWIEIDGVIVAGHTRLSRSPYGERGLKFGDLAPEKAGEVALLTESVD